MPVPLRPAAPAAWLAVSLLAGCASMPEPGAVVTAAVHRVTPADVERMKSLQQAKLQQAGVSPADIAAGRLVQVACAVMADGWWSSLALLPAGLSVSPQEVVQVRVKDPGNNDYEGINEVIGRVTPPLTSGQPAYRFIPDWRERGLAKNIERNLPPGEVRHRFLEVQGSWVVKCRP